MASVDSINAANSGYTSAFLASPKLGVVFGPFDKTEFYINAGLGYHSNDARGATITVNPSDPSQPLTAVPLLVRSKGAEIGVRTQAFSGLDASLALFLLDFDSELLFVGDAGTTVPSRPSQRIGVGIDQHLAADGHGRASISISPTPRHASPTILSAATRSRARRLSSPRAGSRSAATPAGSARCACAASAPGR